MNIRAIAERLQQDLSDSPREKPKKIRIGTELKFVRHFLEDWGYELRLGEFKRWPQDQSPMTRSCEQRRTNTRGLRKCN